MEKNMIKIFNNISLADEECKRIVILALDKSFKKFKGKIPIIVEDRDVGFCFKYANGPGLNITIHADLIKRINEDKVVINLENVTLNTFGKVTKADIEYISII